MQMQKAFNSRMLTKLIKYSVAEGSYDANNRWVEGAVTQRNIFGVIKTGNQFSQFSQGEALITEDGGERYSDYKTLYVTNKFTLLTSDKIKFKGKYFNVLQRSDEDVYGFYSALLEKTKEWTP